MLNWGRKPASARREELKLKDWLTLFGLYRVSPGTNNEVETVLLHDFGQFWTKFTKHPGALRQLLRDSGGVLTGGVVSAFGDRLRGWKLVNCRGRVETRESRSGTGAGQDFPTRGPAHYLRSIVFKCHRHTCAVHSV